MQIEHKPLRASALQTGDDLEQARTRIEADIECGMADDTPATLQSALDDLVQRCATKLTCGRFIQPKTAHLRKAISFAKYAAVCFQDLMPFVRGTICIERRADQNSRLIDFRYESTLTRSPGTGFDPPASVNRVQRPHACLRQRALSAPQQPGWLLFSRDDPHRPVHAQ